ncbi:hypothetical protein EDB87DRAFT_1679872 [Lactarius vividus]|nr:hypothetical protein EDB87DRAFT_1679872 [Lactarius vividus]
MLAGPRSQLEIITGEGNPDKSQRRGGIVRLTVDAPSAHAAGKPQPPRWRTYEYFLYYFIFIVAFSWMVYIPIEVRSRQQRRTVPLLSHKPPSPRRAHGRLLRLQICLHTPHSSRLIPDGAQYFVHELVSSLAGIRFLFVGVQLMFEYRRKNYAGGYSVDVKCMRVASVYVEELEQICQLRITQDHILAADFGIQQLG